MDIITPTRELATEAYHRLYKSQRLCLLNSFPFYFSIVQTVEQKKNSKWFQKMWTSAANKPIYREEKRYITFEENKMIILRYLGQIQRPYGIFEAPKQMKGLPSQAFDSEVIFETDLFNLDRMHILNYMTVKAMVAMQIEKLPPINLQFQYSDLLISNEPQHLNFEISREDLHDFVEELRD